MKSPRDEQLLRKKLILDCKDMRNFDWFDPR